MEGTTLYSIGIRPFECGLPHYAYTASDILLKFPSKKKKNSRLSFKNEITLARFRMGKLPTRLHAVHMGLDDNPLCRHCSMEFETEDHLLNCPSLSFREFLPAGNMHLIRLALQDAENSRKNENMLLKFVAHNDLFCPVNTESESAPLPSETPKRAAELTPSPKRRLAVLDVNLLVGSVEMNLTLLVPAHLHLVAIEFFEVHG